MYFQLLDVLNTFSDLADEVLGDDDVFILESIAEAKKNDEETLRVTLILTLKDNLLSISRIIKIIEVGKYTEHYLFQRADIYIKH